MIDESNRSKEAEKLPQSFRKKMQMLLGEEYPDFLGSYEKPRHRGLRFHAGKVSREEEQQMADRILRDTVAEGSGEIPSAEPVPFVEHGYQLPLSTNPARHPYYAAGLFYLQEPSAMAPASCLPLAPGDLVLDLCAAPGGKATELAVRVEKLGGILVANETDRMRARALLHNLEKTGVRQVCILSETTGRLARHFPEQFDKILVDAPCSGEGMFRKEEAAISLWSEKRVQTCAEQQAKILEHAYAMLRPGGLLLYATCTFSPEEDEEQIAKLMHAHSELQMVEIPMRPGFSEGRSDWLSRDMQEKLTNYEELRKCVRLWPHHIAGEGHFFALLQKGDPRGEKEGAEDAEKVPDANQKKQRKTNKRQGAKQKEERFPTREEKSLLAAFLYGIVGDAAFSEDWQKRVEKRQGKAILPAWQKEALENLHVMRNGLYLGDWKKNRFEPAQALAMTLAATDCRRVLSLSMEDARLQQVLRGGSISASTEETQGKENPVSSQIVQSIAGDWVLLCIEQYPLAWGKYVQGKIKNKLPAGWRQQ